MHKCAHCTRYKTPPRMCWSKGQKAYTQRPASARNTYTYQKNGWTRFRYAKEKDNTNTSHSNTEHTKRALGQPIWTSYNCVK